MACGVGNIYVNAVLTTCGALPLDGGLQRAVKWKPGPGLKFAVYDCPVSVVVVVVRHRRSYCFNYRPVFGGLTGRV